VQPSEDLGLFLGVRLELPPERERVARGV
jgi:hypothetical protein